MPGDRIRRYLDTSVFIEVIAGQPKAPQCAEVLRAAEQGLTEVVISPVVQAELLKVSTNGGTRDANCDAERDMLRQYLRHAWLHMQPVTQRAGVLAQQYRWEYRLKTPDALHLACAIEAKSDVFETLNTNDFLHLAGDFPSLDIRTPQWEGDRTLPVDESQQPPS